MVKIIDSPGSDDGGQNPDVKDKDVKPTTIQVDDQVYTPDDVKELLDQQAAVTQGGQEIAALKSVAEKYGVPVDKYVEQAEGSFAVMTELIKEGIIDNQGQVLKKPPGDLPVDPLITDPKVKVKTEIEDKTELTTDPAVLAALTSIGDRLKVLDQTQTNMIRADLQKQIKGKHEVLTDNDVNEVFARTMNNPEKDLWAHAEDKVKEREAENTGARENFAKEFGVDLVKFDENRLLQKGPEGGAGAMFKDKKFIFGGKNKRGEEGIDPGKAASEWIAAKEKVELGG